ncbi:NADH-quinone oxidoreductase subunit K [Dietzia sp. CH92]|uniref:NADH-quinone oxidoreductase subunit K n=1 Tax=Dietzia sp. CH92 TaxID=3051823 RepID=UPI0028D6325B|nr:NADH-quinone oxidoreductase subunit K [Dietzia sp. CH92]
MSTLAWYAAVGAALFALGLVTMLVAADRFRRLVALNVAAAGSLVMLLSVAGREETADPVLHALALTGIVITVAFTGFGVVLARRIDDEVADGEAADTGPADSADADGGGPS